MKILQGQSKSIEIDELILHSHSGKTIDLSRIFSVLEIIEEIDNFVTLGILVFPDVLGTVEMLPIIGGEKVTIKFRTSNEFGWFSKDLYVIKIPDETVNSAGHKISSVRLDLASKPLLENYKQQYSLAYNKKSVHTIAQDIAENQLKISLAKNEVSQNIISFVIPYWNPFKSIQFLMRHGISVETKDSGYFFFEDSKGYNFVTLAALFSSQSVEKVLNISTQKLDEVIGRALTVNAVNYHELIKTVDIIEQFKQGACGSTIWTFDYSIKNVMKRSINWQKYYDEATWNLGKNTLLPSSYINKEGLVGEHSAYISDRFELPNIIEEQSKILLQNRNRYNGIQNCSMFVGKNGDSDLTVGKLVEIQVMSINSSNRIHDKLYGKYLVRSLRHVINAQNGYTQNLLLVKDSYFSDENNCTYKIKSKTNP